MAEPLPPRPRQMPPPPSDTSPSEGGGLQRRMMGLPMWGWIAIAAAGGIVLILWYQNKKNNQPAPGANADVTGTDTTQGLATSQYEALLAQLRDLQGANSVPATPSSNNSGDKDKDKDKGNKDLTIKNLKQIPGTIPGEITIDWDDVRGAVYYVVSRDNGAATDNAFGSSYTSRYNAPGSSHSFTVQAKTATGTGPVSTPISAKAN